MKITKNLKKHRKHYLCIKINVCFGILYKKTSFMVKTANEVIYVMARMTSSPKCLKLLKV